MAHGAVDGIDDGRGDADAARVQVRHALATEVEPTGGGKG
jgi:hypothetical protein